MPSVKVVFLTSTTERGEFTKRLAPPDFEVVLVDNRLSDAEKIPLCKDADAIITVPADVSVELLAHCPKVKLIQTHISQINSNDHVAIHWMMPASEPDENI